MMTSALRLEICASAKRKCGWAQWNQKYHCDDRDAEFLRIKVGVGEKPAGWDLADHVLGHFDAADRVEVEKAIGHAVEAAEMMITGETDAAMNRYNVKRRKSEKEYHENFY